MNADIQKAIDDVREAQKTLKKLASERGEEIFRGLVSELFAAVGDELHAVRLQGYIPFFNDGDACVFGLYDPTWRFDEDGEFEEGTTGFEYCDADYPGAKSIGGGKYYYAPSFVADEAPYQRFSSEVAALESFWNDAFGDHFEITATKDGVEVDEYTDHD